MAVTLSSAVTLSTVPSVTFRWSPRAKSKYALHWARGGGSVTVTGICSVSTSPIFPAWYLCCFLGVTWTPWLEDSVLEGCTCGTDPQGEAESALQIPFLRLFPHW